MKRFETLPLPAAPDDAAPDGSAVRNLLRLPAGGMAIFDLAPGEITNPVAHKTVEEIWYFLAGRGEFWRRLDDHEEVVEVEPGTCLTIPRGTHFQFRSLEGEGLSALAVTMPPWPGKDEAHEVPGNTGWKPTRHRES